MVSTAIHREDGHTKKPGNLFNTFIWPCSSGRTVCQSKGNWLTRTIKSFHSAPAYSLPASLSMANPPNFETGSRQLDKRIVCNPYHPNTTALSHISGGTTLPLDTSNGDPGYYGRKINAEGLQELRSFIVIWLETQLSIAPG